MPTTEMQCEACGGRGLVDVETAPPRKRRQRKCSNCTRVVARGMSLRNGRCEACARYWGRKGQERPQELEEARLHKLEEAADRRYLFGASRARV